MKKLSFPLAVLACLSISTAVSFAGTWVESSQADFADGDFNANVFTSKEGSDSGCVKSAPGAFYDLNKDGRPDIIICNLEGSYTYIYWGKHDWTYSADSSQSLPSSGSTGNSVDDIDKDGNLDILISNYYGNAVIYWGSKAGYSADNSTTLTAYAGHGNSIVDLNHDGALDILVSRMNGTEIYIFWGNKKDRRSFIRTTLSGFSSSDVAVSDLNKDGVLDIVVPNKQGNYPPAGGFTFSIPSYIYYGQKSQDSVFYNDNAKDSLETYGAYCVSIGDVDKDGWLDIVFSNHRNDATYNVNSYIYWGSATGFKTKPRQELETHSAIGNTIVDLDRDGNNDIIFANWYNDLSYKINSFVYWGPDFSARTELPTNGAHGALVGKLSNNSINDVLITNSYGGWSYIFHGVSKTGYISYDSLPSSYGHISTKDNGNIHNRGKTETYNSSVFGNGTDTYSWGTCSWNATLPVGTSLQVQLRSGNTANPDDGAWSTWSPVVKSGGKAGLANSKYTQYQVIFTTNDYFGTPTVDGFSLDYQIITGIAGGAGEESGRKYFKISNLPKLGGADIVYQLSVPERVRINIYNIEGRLVANLANTVQSSGQHQLKWEAKNASGSMVSSGIYICRAEIGRDIYFGKIVLVK
ncbi:VCBS repeat-containing protein [candidate division TA06 bacterium]|uniref:VCBS repeat-containing protein n=1 Tax=candidate division TA06 bacterium TaxID=2250710 RepID=A0A933MLC9_UNCT6|nr:VCBS repeat-containing protein [candidate division TA06 bacterium]